MVLEVTLALALGLAILAPALRRSVAAQKAVVPVLLVSLATFPQHLYGPGGGGAGVAGEGPVIYSSTVGLMVVLASIRASRSGIAWALAPWAVFLALYSFRFWPQDSRTYAALFAFGTAILAWIAGARLGAKGLAQEVNVEREILTWVKRVAVFQLAVCVLQLLGAPIFAMDADTSALMGFRTNGSLNHPNNLGKVAVLLGALILPSLRNEDRATRTEAARSLLILSVVVLLAQGRANIVALGALIIAFALLGYDSGRFGHRVKMPTVLLIAALPFVPRIAERFSEDPAGGARDRLTDVAMAQLEITPSGGIGPNHYVQLVNPKFGEGLLPVHNSYLLFRVEMGWVGTLLIFGVLSLVAIWGLSVALSRRSGATEAAALVALSLASVPMAVTGWGIVSYTVFPLWLFSIAYLAARTRSLVRRPATISEHELTTGEGT